MNIVYQITGWFGASKSFIAKADTSMYPGLDFYVKAASEANVQWGPTFEALPSFASDQFYKVLDTVTYGKATSKEAAQALQTAVDAEMTNRFPNGV